MNDREKVYKKIKKIAAELSGCIAGLFLFYGIKCESPTGEKIIDLIHKLDKQIEELK